MVIINSTENKNFKLCQQLASRKYRDKLGLYLIEGPNLLTEAMECHADIRVVLVSESKLSVLSELLVLPGVEPLYIAEGLFHKLAQTEHSQGVLAVVAKPEEESSAEMERMLRPGSNVLILDRLQDPGNIGTIIRTAEAAGYQGVIALKGTGDIFSPKVIRAAAGSVFRMPVLFLESPAQTMELLKKYKKEIVTTSLATETPYYDMDLKENIGLVIGNEGNGICPEFFAGADRQIKIPMAGRIESLNAAVAAGIIMYEAMRK